MFLFIQNQKKIEQKDFARIEIVMVIKKSMKYRELQKKLSRIRDDFKIDLHCSLTDKKEVLEKEYRRVGHFQS